MQQERASSRRAGIPEPRVNAREERWRGRPVQSRGDGQNVLAETRKGEVRAVAEHGPIVGHPLLIIHHVIERSLRRQGKAAHDAHVNTGIATAIPRTPLVTRAHAERGSGHHDWARVAHDIESNVPPG